MSATQEWEKSEDCTWPVVAKMGTGPGVLLALSGNENRCTGKQIMQDTYEQIIRPVRWATETWSRDRN
jgi:hypothetical protein